MPLTNSVHIDNIPSEIASLAEAHVKGFRSTHDEVYDCNPICQGCNHAWPCDTFRVLQVVESLNVELRSAYEAGGF